VSKSETEADLEYKYSSDENTDDVEDGEKKTECSKHSGLSRHVTAVDKLVTVVTQLCTVQCSVLYQLHHTHRLHKP